MRFTSRFTLLERKTEWLLRPSHRTKQQGMGISFRFEEERKKKPEGKLTDGRPESRHV
jgi:hypothetical protein